MINHFTFYQMGPVHSVARSLRGNVIGEAGKCHWGCTGMHPAWQSDSSVPSWWVFGGFGHPITRLHPFFPRDGNELQAHGHLTGSARVCNWRWHRSLLRREGNGVWESSWGYVPLLDDFMLLFSLVSPVPNPLDKHSGLPWQCVKLPGNVMLSILPCLCCHASTHHEKGANSL